MIEYWMYLHERLRNMVEMYMDRWNRTTNEAGTHDASNGRPYRMCYSRNTMTIKVLKLEANQLIEVG